MYLQYIYNRAVDHSEVVGVGAWAPTKSKEKRLETWTCNKGKMGPALPDSLNRTLVLGTPMRLTNCGIQPETQAPPCSTPFGGELQRGRTSHGHIAPPVPWTNHTLDEAGGAALRGCPKNGAPPPTPIISASGSPCKFPGHLNTPPQLGWPPSLAGESATVAPPPPPCERPRYNPKS